MGMLERIAVGVNDVELLAGEAREFSAARMPTEGALVGKLEPVYQLLLRQHMDQVRLLRRQIEQVNQALAEAMKEHIAVLHRLSRIPGLICTRRRTDRRDRPEAARLLPRAVRLLGGVCPAVRNRRCELQ